MDTGARGSDHSRQTRASVAGKSGSSTSHRAVKASLRSLLYKHASGWQITLYRGFPPSSRHFLPPAFLASSLAILDDAALDMCHLDSVGESRGVTSLPVLVAMPAISIRCLNGVSRSRDSCEKLKIRSPPLSRIYFVFAEGNSGEVDLVLVIRGEKRVH